MSTLDKKIELADEAFENYDFQDGITVEAHDGWDTEDENDFIKVAYVSYEEDNEDDDTHKVSFHVNFNSKGSVSDSYGYELSSGNEV